MSKKYKYLIEPEPDTVNRAVNDLYIPRLKQLGIRENDIDEVVWMFRDVFMRGLDSGQARALMALGHLQNYMNPTAEDCEPVDDEDELSDDWKEAANYLAGTDVNVEHLAEYADAYWDEMPVYFNEIMSWQVPGGLWLKPQNAKTVMAWLIMICENSFTYNSNALEEAEDDIVNNRDSVIQRIKTLSKQPKTIKSLYAKVEEACSDDWEDVDD